MISKQLGLIKHIPKGTVLTVRPAGPAYQVLTGEFAGKYIEPSKCYEISGEKLLSTSEWLEMEQGYLSIIKNLERENENLRIKCATHDEVEKKLEYFLQVSTDSLIRIAELKREKETAERMS